MAVQGVGAVGINCLYSGYGPIPVTSRIMIIIATFILRTSIQRGRSRHIQKSVHGNRYMIMLSTKEKLQDAQKHELNDWFMLPFHTV